MKAARFNVATAILKPGDEDFEIADIEPGEYIVEILKMPADPTDMEAYKKMDRTPHFRKTITVKEKDYKLNIDVK